MGLVSGIIRLQYLKEMELDLEYKIQTLTQTKMQLSSQALDLETIGTDLDPGSPEVKHLENRREKLHLIEKKIDAEVLRHQTMLRMAQTEIESAQKIVDKSIERIFKY